MKRNLILILTFFLFNLCQGQKVKMSLKLSKNESYSLKCLSDITINQEINGQEIKMVMSVNGDMVCKVTGIQDSVYDMEVSYTSLSMKMSLPEKDLLFSSEKNDKDDVFSTILGLFKGKVFNVKMTKTGKIKEVKNIETVFASIFDQFPQLSDEQKEQLKTQILQAYGEKAFKGNIEMVTNIFSYKKVKAGDNWIIKTQIESGMAGKMETVYKLEKQEESFYLISGKSKFETENKDAYIQVNGMPIKYDLQGTVVSDLKIDKKTGWIIEAKINQKIAGNAYIKENPKMQEGMVIPMVMENVMTITK
jgi:hypothetical protein